MPSRSRSAKQSSISARLGLPGLLVGGHVVLGRRQRDRARHSSSALTAAIGLVAATAFAGAFAVYLIVSERRRHEDAEDGPPGAGRLPRVARALDRRSSPTRSSPDEILERTRRRPCASSTPARPTVVPAAEVEVGRRACRSGRDPRAVARRRRAGRDARAAPQPRIPPRRPDPRDDARRLRLARGRERAPPRRGAGARGRARHGSRSG